MTAIAWRPGCEEICSCACVCERQTLPEQQLDGRAIAVSATRCEYINYDLIPSNRPDVILSAEPHHRPARVYTPSGGNHTKHADSESPMHVHIMPAINQSDLIGFVFARRALLAIHTCRTPCTRTLNQTVSDTGLYALYVAHITAPLVPVPYCATDSEWRWCFGSQFPA